MSLQHWLANLYPKKSGSRLRRRIRLNAMSTQACEQLEGKVLLSSVSGTVFEDWHANGIPDANERRIEGITVALWNVGPDQLVGTSDDVFAGSTRTGATGAYSIAVHAAGTYVARIGEQSGAYRFIEAALDSPVLFTGSISSEGLSAPFPAGPSANDVEINGPLAHVGSEQARARLVEQSWSFRRTHVNYLLNVYGQQEKWLKSSPPSGEQWFFITPEGDLYRWDRVSGIASGEFIASVGTDVYLNPALLHDAPAVVETYSTREADLAWELDSQLHFVAASSWHDTYGNLDVRWISGDRHQHGNPWYFVQQDGSFFAWDGTVRQATGTFLAQLTPSYYVDPVLLTNAVRPFTNGDPRGLLREGFGINEVVAVPQQVTGANGVWFAGSTNQFGNQRYFVENDGRFFAWNGTGSESGRLLGQLPQSVHASPSTFASARFFIDPSSPESAAYDLDRLYGLVPRLWYYDSWSGQNEKWIEGRKTNGASQWFFILPNGDLHEVLSWNNVTRTVNSSLLTTLPPVYYQLPHILHNALKPIPQALTLPGVIQLTEGSPFAREASVDIALGLSAGTPTFSFDVSRFVDSTDTDTVLEDTLAVYLTRTEDRSQTLLDRGTPGTALFTLSGTHADFVPGSVRFNGSVVEIDLSSIAAPQTGRLVFQLLNTDTDLGTRFVIRPLSNEVDEHGVTGPAFDAVTSLVTAAGVLDTSALAPTEQVLPELRNVRYLPSDGVFRAELLLRNEGDLLARTMAVTFPGLPAGVTLRNPSGITAAGVPYINVTAANPSGGLGRGGRSDRIQIEFDNPLDLRFPLRPIVLTAGENHAPVWTTINPLTVTPGDTLVVNLNAVDDDGDRVTYAISASELLPTLILWANGQLEIRPELDQLGSYTFDVIATDGALNSRQTITLDVVADPNTTTRISGVVRSTLDQSLAGVPVEIAGFSSITAADGSFRITLPTMKLPTEAFNISIPAGDVFLDPFNTGTQEIRFRRARHDVTTGDSLLNPRMHPNLVTSFIDASSVYGSDATRAAALRTFTDGQMKTSAGNLLPLNDAATFPTGPLENDNEGRVNPATLFAAGDVRTNENVALIAMHTVFLREHNRLADEIKTGDPSLTDEQIYQQARRMVGAILQHITYNEYLPLLIGADAIPAYVGYDENIDPRESELIATAAFRLGHTQLASEIKRLSADGTTLPGGSLALKDAFFTTAPIQSDGVEPYLRGLAATPMQEVDVHIIDDVRNFLFGPPGSGGMDLASMNIQRGRDVGLPSYNQARLDFGLSAITSFSQITSDVATQAALQGIYGTVDKVDIWVGGIAEDHAPGAQVGPLFQAILKDQFLRSRDGDRFFYENNQFTSAQLTEIRATTIEALIERNAPGVDLPSHPFTTGTQPVGPGAGGTAAVTPPTESRSLDGSGNNQSNPSLGATGGNVIRNFTNGYADGISQPAGADRPGPREISNAVVAQSGLIPSASGATSLLVFWGQILDHDLGLTPGGVGDTLKILGNLRPDPSGNEPYPFVAERMDLMLGHPTYPGVNNVITRPIYLPVLDVAGGTSIDPTQNMTVTQEITPGEMVSVFVAAGTLKDRLGSNFTGVLSITEVPPELTPAALPDNLRAGLVVTIQPADMVFTTPAPLTFPNRDGWAPGTMMDLWSINPITGLFDDVGDMKVSVDGSVIETISGGIRNSSWHLPVRQPEKNRKPKDEKENQDETCNNNEAVVPTNSSVELHSGAVRETHDLVSYQSLGVTRGLTLNYNSQQADPRPIIHFGIDNAVSGNDRLMVARLSFTNGSLTQQVNGFQGGMGLPGGEHFWALPTGTNDLQVALQGDLRSLPSGIYNYTISSGTMRLSDDGEYVGTLTDTSDQIVHINSIDSPFGAGWQLGGVQKLIRAANGSMLFLDGGGAGMLFAPIQDEPGHYTSPVGDFSTLVKNPGGSFTRTMTDQTVYQFDTAGRMVSMTDRNANVTQHIYESGRLTRIVDPVGLETHFAYNGNRVSTITDPAGRTTLLQYDSTGNLLQVTDPDGSSRTWDYDSKHHIVGETDQLGRYEQTFYDTFGRATGSILKDGSVLQVAPVQTGILLPGSATSSPFRTPVASLKSADTISRSVEANGNVTTTFLDKAGQATTSFDAIGNHGSIARNADNLLSSSTNARGYLTEMSYDIYGNLLTVIDSVSRPAASGGSLFPGLKFETGDTPRSIAIGDFDRDGILDIATANLNSDDVSVLLGNGDGTFAAQQLFEVGIEPLSIAIGDFDRDGVLDIATANAFSDDVSVLLGNGNGTFAAQQRFVAGEFPESIAIGDFDGDGDLDIATANDSNDVSVLLGNGDGTFPAQQLFEVGIEPSSIAIGDFDGDGVLDIATANTSSDDVSVLLGNGNGTFAAQQRFAAGNSPDSIAIGDFDGDGVLDIATASGFVTVLLGNGDGTFAAEQLFYPGNTPHSIALGDFDGDGVLDIATANYTNDVSVLLGNGDGTFPAQQSFAAGSGVARSIAIGDFDRDGILDIATANDSNDVSVLLGNGDGTFPAQQSFEVGSTPYSISLGDFDGDGVLDIATANYNSNDVSVLLGNGDGTFPAQQRFIVGNSPDSIALGDFDSDGVLDIATANEVSNDVSVLLGNGDGTFVAQQRFVAGNRPRSIAIGDFDGDGVLDIATANAFSNDVSVLLGNGDGTFPAQQRFVAGNRPRSIAIGDFDGDGVLDIVTTNDFSDDVSVLLGNGDGTFAAQQRFEVGNTPYSIAIGDFDGNGVLDIATANRDSSDVSVLLGNGDGTFASQQRFAAGTAVSSIAIGDLDRDGVLDIATAKLSESVVSVLLGNGNDIANNVRTSRSYTYDVVFNQLTSMTDELGHQTLYEIDVTNGNQLSTTEVIGQIDSVANGETDDLVTSYTYTSQGLLDVLTDPLGRITDYDYNSLGQLIKVTSAKGTTDQAVTMFEYDTAGNQTARIDGNGNRTEYVYDVKNRLTKIVEADPDGAELLASPVTLLDYDARGNLIQTTDPAGSVVINEYDALDRLFSTQDAFDNESTFDYDRNGNVVAVTDPNANTTHYRYDARNRRTTSTDPDGGVTRFRYDSDDNLLFLTDPNGNQTKFSYDARNRTIREVDPLDKDIRYKYDVVDNLIQKIDRNGRITKFAYDDVNRLIRETWLDADRTTVVNTIHYEYDKAGNLLNVDDTFSELTFSYDARNRVTFVGNSGTPDVPDVLLTYTYDAVGNVMSVIDTIGGSAGATIAYGYDALNRTTSIQQSGPSISDKRVEMTYNQLGQYSEISRYDDLSGTNLVARSVYVYDDINRLLSISHGSAASSRDLAFYDFVYDSASRITAITDIDGSTDYGYDDRDQLTSAQHADPANPDESYTYDANGNRLDSHLHGSGYVTGPGNRLLSDGTYNYTYDQEGNMLTRTRITGTEVDGSVTREFTWDHRNRLIAITDKTAGSIITNELTFRYDALNRRIVKEANGAALHFVYDREDVLFDFSDADGLAGPADPALAVRYFHGPGIDQVLAEDRGTGNVHWLLTDHLGTTRDIVDSAGVIANHILLDAYGNILSQTNPAASSRYLFTGREFDTETGLFYYRARYYDAGIGRFVGEDPIRFAFGNANLFSYVNNSPLSNADPFGLHPAIGVLIEAFLENINPFPSIPRSKRDLLEEVPSKLGDFGPQELGESHSDEYDRVQKAYDELKRQQERKNDSDSDGIRDVDDPQPHNADSPKFGICEIRNSPYGDYGSHTTENGRRFQSWVPDTVPTIRAPRPNPSGFHVPW